MDCLSIQELLSVYMDGELSESERRLVEEHIETCSDCRLLLVQFEENSKRVGDLLSGFAPPLELEQRILLRLETAREGTQIGRLSLVFMVSTALCAAVSAIALLSPVGLFFRALFRLGLGVLRGLIFLSSSAGALWLGFFVALLLMLAVLSLAFLFRMLRSPKGEVLL